MTEESGNGRLFVLATTLAREGLFAEATKVLHKALAAGECSEAEALDLQARIYAQEGLGFQAESCWQRMQHLAGLDPKQDPALARMQRSFISAQSLFHVSIAVAVVAVLGLLFWQILFVNPKVANRLASNESSLTALREGLVEFKSSTQSGDQDLSKNIINLNNNLSALDKHLSERLTALSTATGLVQEHAAEIARLNGRIEELHKVFDLRTASPDTHRAQIQELEGKATSHPPSPLVTAKSSTEAPAESPSQTPDNSSKPIGYAPGIGRTSQKGETLYFILGASLKSEDDAQSSLNNALPMLGSMQSHFIVQKSDSFEGMRPGWWVILAAHRTKPSKANLDLAKRAFPGASVRTAIVRTSDPIPVCE